MATKTAFFKYIYRALQYEYLTGAIEQNEVRELVVQSTRQALITTMLTFMLAIFSGIYISFLFSNRILKLKDASEKVGAGDLDIIIEITSRDEIADLSRSFNANDALILMGLNASTLILEITETTTLDETEAAITKLRALKKLGLRLAIEDFGSGYSSLSYLQRFPVDILKIDKAFIGKIASGKEGSAVAKAIITMSETLSMKTVRRASRVRASKQGCKN